MKTMKYYLKERINPQLEKPYYIKYGKISKAQAKEITNSIYGVNNIISFETEEQYNAEIERLIKAGFKVNN